MILPGGMGGCKGKRAAKNRDLNVIGQLRQCCVEANLIKSLPDPGQAFFCIVSDTKLLAGNKPALRITELTVLCCYDICCEQ